MSCPDSTAHWCLLFSAAATHRSWPIQSPTFRRCFDDLPMLPTMRNTPVPIAVGGGITVGAIGATVEAAGTIEAGGSPLPSHVIDVLRPPAPVCSSRLGQCHNWVSACYRSYGYQDCGALCTAASARRLY